MHIKIAAEPLNDKLPQGERKALQVETCVMRGDAFVTATVENVMCDGKDVMFNVPDGAQLVIKTPAATEEVVYDAAQGATIRKSLQANNEGRADRHSEQVDLHREKREEKEAPKAGSQGQDTRSPAERQASQANYVPPGGSRVTSGVGQAPASDAEKAAAEKKRQDELQKVQQSAAAGEATKGT